MIILITQEQLKNAWICLINAFNDIYVKGEKTEIEPEDERGYW